MLACKHVSIGMNGIGKLAWRMTYRLMKTIVVHDFIKSVIYGEKFNLSLRFALHAAWRFSRLSRQQPLSSGGKSSGTR